MSDLSELSSAEINVRVATVKGLDVVYLAGVHWLRREVYRERDRCYALPPFATNLTDAMGLRRDLAKHDLGLGMMPDNYGLRVAVYGRNTQGEWPIEAYAYPVGDSDEDLAHAICEAFIEAMEAIADE
jgi:hypothetical protein